MTRFVYTPALLAAAIFSPIAFAADPGAGNATHWRVGDVPTVEITELDDASLADHLSGDPLAHYLPIGHEIKIEAAASDEDEYCRDAASGGDGQWYPWNDDVISGNTAADYHMIWAKLGGPGEITEEYGTSCIFNAPTEYMASGGDLQAATIEVVASDKHARDGLALGAGDPGVIDQVVIKVWQVTVTSKQAGAWDGANDINAAGFSTVGLPTLGMNTPGAPAGTTGFHGSTENKGAIPSDPEVSTGYSWCNDKKGTSSDFINGQWVVVDDFQNWTPDNPIAAATDVDQSSGGVDTWKIFMVDAPGLGTGAGNNAGIANGTTGLDFRLEFRSYVKLNGIVISNKEVWEVDFELKAVNGVWTILQNHTP